MDWMDGMNGWMDGMNEWMDWMDGMNEWMDELVNGQVVWMWIDETQMNNFTANLITQSVSNTTIQIHLSLASIMQSTQLHTKTQCQDN